MRTKHSIAAVAVVMLLGAACETTTPETLSPSSPPVAGAEEVSGGGAVVANPSAGEPTESNEIAEHRRRGRRRRPRPPVPTTVVSPPIEEPLAEEPPPAEEPPAEEPPSEEPPPADEPPAEEPPGAQQPAISYNDPTTGALVHRLTTDGAAGCINYMGNLSGEAISWSPDSNKITYAKRCDAGATPTGIYVYDIATATERCLASTDSQWTYPIFNHDGTAVYFVDGSDSKRYALYTAPEATSGAGCATASMVLDLAAQASLDEVRVLTRNTGQTDATQLFATHVRTGNDWRTIIVDGAGNIAPGWGFGTDNPPSASGGDGDASVWSPTDPNLIHTIRSVDNSPSRAVWDVADRTAEYAPFTGSNSCYPQGQIGHSDWIWHPGSQTDVFIAAYSCAWTIDSQGNVGGSNWRLHGYLHPNIDMTSTGGALADIRFVADEYHAGNGAEPFLYVTTLGDIGLGGSGYRGQWSDVRANDKFVGHRNRLDDGTNNGLKAYEPHPQFSPDGRHVLWQSSSLNELAGTTCPASDCGEAGSGADSRISYLDLYIAEVPTH